MKGLGGFEVEEWFDINEERPPAIGRYLVSIVNRVPHFGDLVRMEVGIFNDNRFWDSSLETIKNITHWMFLPKPPKYKAESCMEKLFQECA